MDLKNDVKIPKIEMSCLIFITGHRYDPNCSVCSFPAEIIRVICQKTSIHFKYEYPFDQKGVLSCLRRSLKLNQEGIDQNIISFERESRYYNFLNFIPDFKLTYFNAISLVEENVSRDKVGQILGNCVRGTFISSVAYLRNYFGIQNVEAYLYIDLQRFRLNVNNMTLSCCKMNELSSLLFGLFGSNDKISWDSFLKKKDRYKVKVLTCGNPPLYFVLNFSEIKSNEYYRYFKVLSSANGDRSTTVISGIELYGHLI
jgi:hypothetical protein